MARTRSGRTLSVLPLRGPLSLVPVAAVLGALSLIGMGYTVAQSLGAFPLSDDTPSGFDAYARLAPNDPIGAELWSSAAFTLRVSAASTLLALMVAAAMLAWIDTRGPRGRRAGARLFHVNLALPHVVWAVALLLVLGQSGILARLGHTLGIVDVPADVPVVVEDRFGIGVMLHYASKEAPFLMLVGWAALRIQPPQLGMLADTLGATGWRRVRLLVLPVVFRPMAAASMLVYAFVVGAYEAPALLGVSDPRMLSVLTLELFRSPDVLTRPAAMAVGVATSAMVLGVLLAAGLVVRRWR